MRAGGRPPEPDLKERIGREAYRFDFFQLVYLLEHWRRRLDGREPASPQLSVGHAGPLADEGLRLQPDPFLTFSPADVRRAEPLPPRPDEAEAYGPQVYPEGEIYRVIVNFMGLYGVSAPGPVYFTEMINDPNVETDELRNFLDLFNHRVLSFFYRSWQKYRYPYRYEPGAKDDFSAHVLAFAGLREVEAREQVHLHVPRLIKYLGLLSMRTRPLIGLRLMIADYFRREIGNDEDELAALEQSSPALAAAVRRSPSEVRIRPWVLRWVAIPEEEQNRIGERGCELGSSLTLGEESPNRSGKFRVRIGPLRFAAYRRFLPAGELFRQLCALVRLWVGERFDFDCELVVYRQDVPEVQLGGADSLASSLQLGWTGWVTSGPGLAADPSIVFPKRNPEVGRRPSAVEPTFDPDVVRA